MLNHVLPPPALEKEIEDAEKHLADAREELECWRKRNVARKNVCWFEWHEANGWPDMDGAHAEYKNNATRQRDRAIHDYGNTLGEIPDFQKQAAGGGKP